MGFLSNLFGPPDPTKDWPPPIEGSLPVVDLTAKTFGSLRFEDGIDSAYFLGKPDQNKITKHCHDLYYHRQGFVVCFEGGRFVELQFHLVPETGSRYKSAQPRATGGVILSPDSSRKDLESTWGPPAETNHYGTYEIVQYLYGQLVSEFEYDVETGKLTFWTIYLDE